MFKNLFLCFGFLALAACSSAVRPYDTDDYYIDDFSIEEEQDQSVSLVEEKEVKAVARKANKKSEKVTPVRKTLTEVSKKVADIETTLRNIQKTIEKNSETLLSLKIKGAEEARMYYEYVAQINARLRIGTTPGNPELSQMWERAVLLLSQADINAQQMTKLSVEDVRLKNELESLLLVIAGTYKISGAMEFDHENLKLLEDDANQTIITLRRLSSDTSSQISRQEQFYAMETRNIDALKTDIRYGKISGAGFDSFESIPSIAKGTIIESLPRANLEGRKPLMVIRFSQENVAYKQQLYEAVKLSLEKRPSTNFEVVAVISQISSEGGAVKNAKEVYEALIEMGVPRRRISLSETIDTSLSNPQVSLYLK